MSWRSSCTVVSTANSFTSATAPLVPFTWMRATSPERGAAASAAALAPL
eukprot:CAMPEP_0182836906 /NCGR_PEP_ID=MMETSP0006_2-20121128/22378_1 /TAXON_ID=97485 /ORGANISM="Prymnesium parvum, Strain Texoma1" /LENGTH=48 /DNA_ID= /DNA_START= /DNA_END= /DNA_ORIENTATION=